jgi:hypothetical protein
MKRIFLFLAILTASLVKAQSLDDITQNLSSLSKVSNFVTHQLYDKKGNKVDTFLKVLEDSHGYGFHMQLKDKGDKQYYERVSASVFIEQQYIKWSSKGAILRTAGTNAFPATGSSKFALFFDKKGSLFAVQGAHGNSLFVSSKLRNSQMLYLK